MKKLAVAFVLVAAALSGSRPARADKITELNPDAKHFPTKEKFAHTVSGAGSSNLVYHTGGATITSAHIVAIFWGPSWSTGGSDNALSNTLKGYITNFGGTGEYNTITQYYSGSATNPTYIQKTSLGPTNTVYDTSTPPQNVTDAILQQEVQKIVSQYGFDSSAIYEVFMPASSYSSSGTSDSCGGPNLAYCAYHSHYTSGTEVVKYASMPYPSCGGCQSAGFNTAQNFEHFISHETREAVTDALGNAWYDRSGNEADDKCAWSPAPFIDSATGYAYQYEWSNANGGCIQTR